MNPPPPDEASSSVPPNLFSPVIGVKMPLSFVGVLLEEFVKSPLMGVLGSILTTSSTPICWMTLVTDELPNGFLKGEPATTFFKTLAGDFNPRLEITSFFTPEGG